MMFIRLTKKSGTLHLETGGRAVCGRVGGEVVEAAGPVEKAICPNCTRISRQRRERAATRGEEVAPPVVVVVAGEVDRLRGEVLRLRGELVVTEERLEIVRDRNKAHVQTVARLTAEKAETDRANEKLRAANAEKSARLTAIEKAGGAAGLAAALEGEKAKSARLAKMLAEAQVALTVARERAGGAK